MASIMYHDIKTNLDIIKEIYLLEIDREINRHTYLKLSALIRDEKKDDYIKEINEKKQLEITYGKDNTVLIKGMMLNIQISAVNQVYYLNIEAVSNSYKADIKKVSRSFQDKDMTYRAMVKSVIKTHDGGDIDDKASEGTLLESFIMQYNETDWEFLKRMASHFNAGLVPSLDFESPKITFGVPLGDFIGVIDEYNYTIEKDLAYYMESSQNTNPSFTELDSVQFIVETDRDFDIGDTCKYQNINLYTKRKSVKLIKGILRFTYMLSTLRGLSQPKVFNDKIVGLSLKGRVLEAVQDRVKVHLEIDESQSKDTAWEFPYSTMYTAEGNSGWYCMPEVNDTVFIYFPNKEEHYGYGVNSIRVLNKKTDKINDPDIKYFRTIDGKELKFSSEEILITCINGVDEENGEPRVTYIRLNQNEGIVIATTESINVKSDKDINIEAAEVIKVLAEEQIRLKCKTSEILIDSKVDICGKDVKIN